MGLKTLGRLQWGLEATAGTATTSPVRAMGLTGVTWHENNNVDMPVELRASMAQHHRGDILSKQADIAVEGYLSFQDAPFLFAAAVKAGTAGVSDSGSANPAYLYTYDPTLSAPDDPSTFTFEVGDDTQAYETAYGFATNLEISAAIKEWTRFTTDLVGRVLSATTFTSSSNRECEYAKGQNWAIYVDATGGTVGTTQYSGCITGFTWRLPESYMPHHCLDGNLYFSRHEQTPLAPELTFTVELDALAISSLRAAHTNGTRQLIRLKNVGSQIHVSTPAATANHYIQIDGAYRITDWGPVGGADNDGVQTVQVTCIGEYDVTWGKLFQIQVNTDRANLGT